MRILELWPTGKVAEYDPITGERVEQKSVRAVSDELLGGKMVKCPKCGGNYFTHKSLVGTKENLGKINYCYRCRRLLWDPFTRWEKIRFWLRHFGDTRWMTEFPMFKLIEVLEDDKAMGKETKKRRV